MTDGIRLIIETQRGVLIRTVESASPLRDDVRRGAAAEEATRDAAATWGLPDFVYRPGRLDVGSGSREIGDGALIVGDRGVVIQVKARDDGRLGDEEREHRWLTKHIEKGLKQAHGTIRTLRRAPMQMTNGRGRVLEVDGASIRWSAVVVVEHPVVPEGFTPAVEQQPNPSLVVLRRDWEFLFDQLKSTYAVVEYVERVAGQALELGDEIPRYYQLAQADEAASPTVLNPRLLGPGGWQFSAPLLPMQPAATAEDRQPHLLVRLLLEDVAVTGGPSFTEEERVQMLAALDRLTVAVRAEIGKFVLAAMDEMTQTPADTPEWRIRWAVAGSDGERPVQLGMGVCSAPHSEMIQDLFGWRVLLRHHDLRQVFDNPDAVVTAGIILTPRNDGTRPWDTTAVAVRPGDPGLTPEEIAALRQAWPSSEDG